MGSWTIQIEDLCDGLLPEAFFLSHKVYGLGNRDLITLSWTALFCSVRCPGGLVLKAYDLAQRLRREAVPVVCGFHSPVEKEVFRILLASRVPICMVPARNLPSRFPSDVRKAIDDGRLLVLSPFGDGVSRATRDTATLRNRFVGMIAVAILIAYAGPNSQTQTLAETLLLEKKPVYIGEHPAHAGLASRGAKGMKELAFAPPPI